jgi:uncharacterized protein (TIGR02284 family)
MTQEEIIVQLNSLIKLDYDAARAYDQAIDEIDVPTIRDQLTQFRNDHERHVSNVSSLVRRYGGAPAERSRDLKGFLIEGMTAIRGKGGTESALNAMRSNERLTNKNYQQAVNLNMPSDINEQLDRNFADEQRHLEYVEQAINGRIWEPSEARYR